MALTTLNNNSLHAITDGSALKNITGTVLQVVQFVWPTYQQVTQNSYQATGLTKAITPKSSSSNILVNISVNSGNSGTNAAENAFALYRGSSLLETYERGIFAYDPGGANVHVDANIFFHC